MASSIQKFGDYLGFVSYMRCTKQGGWQPVETCAFKDLTVSPFSNGWHYGQLIFEGMKFYFTEKGEIYFTLPSLNHQRLNSSAVKMLLPQIDWDQFIEAIREVVFANREYYQANCYYYVRPFITNVSPVLMPGKGNDYLFAVGVLPVEFMERKAKVYVSTDRPRAFPGAVGDAKACGNYGNVLSYEEYIKSLGYDGILYLDALEHRRIEEIGTMAPVFVFKNRFVVPEPTDTIIQSTTSHLVSLIAEEMQYEFVMKNIFIDEIIHAHENGFLLEAFSVGTASLLDEWGSLHKGEAVYHFERSRKHGNIASIVRKRMHEIHAGARPKLVHQFQLPALVNN